MLRAVDYPAEKRAFLLRLMDLFHLSYPLDDEGGKELVPTLLPLNPPAGTDEPEDTNRVRLRYEFQVVPANEILQRRHVSLEVATDGALRLLPHRHGTDGFYAIALARG